MTVERWTVGSEPVVTVQWSACYNVDIVVSQGQVCLCFAEKYLEMLVLLSSAPLDWHNAILIIVKS